MDGAGVGTRGGGGARAGTAAGNEEDGDSSGTASDLFGSDGGALAWWCSTSTAGATGGKVFRVFSGLETGLLVVDERASFERSGSLTEVQGGVGEVGASIMLRSDSK